MLNTQDNLDALDSLPPTAEIVSLPVGTFHDIEPAPECDGLVTLMAEHGQLEPIFVDCNNTLLDGRRRIAVALRLGWTFIRAYRLETCGAAAEIVTIQNRLSRQRQTVLIDAEDFLRWKIRYEELHPETSNGGNKKVKAALKKQKESFSFCKMAADRTNRHEKTVRNLIQIASRVPKQTKDYVRTYAPKLANAQGELLALTRVPKQYGVDPTDVVKAWIQQRKKNITITQAAEQVKRDMKVKQPCHLPYETERYALVLGDFREAMKVIPDASVDMVLTDFPYQNDYVHLFPELFKESARVLKPMGVLGIEMGRMYKNRMIAVGETVEELSYYWDITVDHGEKSTSPIKGRQIFGGCKDITVYVKGKPNDYSGPTVPDIFRGGGKDKEWHVWGQSVQEFEWMIEKFSPEGDETVIVDPFCGGGTTLVAALKKGRRCFGIDIDEFAIEITRRRIELLSGKTLTASPHHA